MRPDDDEPATRAAISEVASILATGYLRYRKARRLEPETMEPENDVSDGENPPVLKENGLDCPRNRSNHSEPR